MTEPAGRLSSMISLPPDTMKKFAWICIYILSLLGKAEVAAEAAAVPAETGGDGGNDRALDGDLDRPCSLICLNGGSCQLSTQKLRSLAIRASIAHALPVTVASRGM